MKLLVGINKITIDEKSKLNAGEYNIHEVEFEFDEVYNGLITKAVFEGNGHSYLIDIVNNKCTIPYEVLSEKGDITIGAYGYNIDGNDLVLRYSPSPIYTYVDLGSYRDSYDNYQQPTADIIEQLTNRIETAESQINEALEEVEEYNDRITTNTNNIDNLDNNKVDKIEGKCLSSNDYTNEEKTKLEGIETNAEVNIIEDIKVNNTSQSINNKSVNISIPTKTSDITNDSGFIDNSVNNLMNYTKSSDLATVATSGSYNDLSNKPTIPDVSSFITKDVNNLTNYTLKTDTGSLIDLEINNTTYVVTLSLKDIDGNVISTDTVDLPLENVVVSGRYDNNTKKVILTLENGSEVDFSVADLVADLQTEITSTNKLASDLVDDSNSGNKFTNTSEKATWNAKYDKPISGIPKSDLTNDVQSSLNLADSALQSFTETDPIFSNSASAGITSNDISKWNNKQDTLIAGANITIDNDGKTISATDTTYNDATTSASGLMSASDKTKLNGIETEANKTIVDDDFSDSSTNPLQNKVITDFIGTNATVTGTGTEFNLSNCLNKKLKDFKGYGDTKQDSLSGKNLFDGLISNGRWTYIAGTTIVVDNRTGYRNTNPININPSTTYYLSAVFKKTNIIIVETDENNIILAINENQGYKEYTNLTINERSGFIIKTHSEAKYLYWYIPDAPDRTSPEKLMLEESSTATDFEPYCGGIPAPNPDYPIPFYGVTGRQVVKFNSKNLFKNVYVDRTLNGITLTKNKDGSITLNGTANGTVDFNLVGNFSIVGNNTIASIDVISGSAEYSSSALRVEWNLSDSSWGNRVYTNIDTNFSTKLFEGITYDRCTLRIQNGVVCNNLKIGLQVEEGPTATKYEPYQHEEYEINLGNIKLYENDYIHKIDNDWYVESHHREYELAIADMNNNNEDYPGWINLTQLKNDLPNVNGYLQENTSFVTNISINKRIGINTNGSGVLWLEKIDFKLTQTEWKEKYPNLIFKILYMLKEPERIKITNEELINQLDAIQPILGDNIITVDTSNELTMSVDIEAYTNTLSGKLEYLLDNI